MLEHATLQKKKQVSIIRKVSKIQVILLRKKRSYTKSIYYTTAVGMTASELYLNECPARNSKEFTDERQPLLHYCTSRKMVPDFNLQQESLQFQLLWQCSVSQLYSVKILSGTIIDASFSYPSQENAVKRTRYTSVRTGIYCV